MPRTLNATLLCIAAALSAHSQNTLDKTGLGAGTTASAAYSMRRLSSSYSGKLLQVRRSTDNTTQDIGYTVNGDLDTATLKTFAGSGDAFVSAWYDQSGHSLNLTQASTGNQPTLVSAGVIQRENTRPFIRFYGAPHIAAYSLNLAAQMTTVGHVSAVMKFDAAGWGFILSHTSLYNWHSNRDVALIWNIASTSVQNGAGWYNGVSSAPASIPWPSSLTIEELEPSTPSSGTNWDNIGTDRNVCCHVISGGGGYSELILFSTALSTANRQTLETSQLAYFGINTLPVTWLTFTARLDDGATRLQWQTAAEQNSKDFTVQHSTNGDTWTNLATLPAAGNSSAATSYSYVHPTPAPGDNYYRIAETDLDGRTTYSNINTIHLAPAQSEFQVLQNPAAGSLLRVRVNTPTTLSLYTMDGKLLQRSPYAEGTFVLPLDGYPNGTYLLTGKTTTVQVLVQ